MYGVDLSKFITKEEVDYMSAWINQNSPGGYVGEGDVYWTDNNSLRFHKIAYLINEEDAMAFKLRFEL